MMSHRIYQFQDDGEVPNNSRLPLVVIHSVEAKAADDPADWFEQRFIANDWRNTWRWGIYPFHHFHSTNHEVLGVSQGWAKLVLGGKGGVELQVEVGDVLIIPAGVGHMCADAAPDFEVVGAYPGGREPDLIRAGEDGLDAARTRIEKVALPEEDPLEGAGGMLFDHWK